MIRITAGLTFLVASVGASQACYVPFTKIIPDVTITGQMYAVSGKRCGIGVAESAGGAQSHTVTRQPSHGKIEIRGLAIFYTSKPGFVGKDGFGYVRRSLDPTNGRPITLPVVIDVTVAADRAKTGSAR